MYKSECGNMMTLKMKWAWNVEYLGERKNVQIFLVGKSLKF
jgi:hypothetical protein